MSGVNFRAALRSAITNAAYLIKNAPDIMLYKLGLNDQDAGNSSGPSIDNTQKFINQIADTSGETEDDANRKVYSSNNYVADGDSRKVAVGKLDAQAQVNADGIQSINDSIGQPDGIAPLDSGGLVPAANLPSYVDDVEEYADLTSFPVTGETGKIYVALDTGRIYRWSGSIYVEISQSPVDSVNGNTGTVVLDNTDIGLGNVTNDAQLKREAGDINTFTEKVSPVVDDIVLIEDSEDAFNKKKVKLQNMLGGGGGGGLDAYYTQDFESFQITDLVDTGNDPIYGDNSVDITAKISLETTDPIAGDQSLQYTGNGSDQGDWAAIANIIVRDRERSVSNARTVWLDNQSSVDIELIIFDVTNSVVLKSQTALAGSGLKKYLIEFIPNSTTNEIQFGFQVLGDMIPSEFALMDNIEFTVDPFVYASINEENVFSAKISNLGVIDSENVNFIDSVSRPATGLYNITFVAGFFTEIPAILVSPELGGVNFNTAEYSGLTASGVTIRTSTVNDTVVNLAFSIQATNQGTDYKAPTENVVTPAKSNMFDTKIVQGITVEAVTTDPTKGTTLIDQIEYSQIGDKGFFIYRYEQDSAGLIGSGDYLYSLPDDLEFSDDVKFYTGAASTLQADDVITSAYGQVYSRNSGAVGVDGFIIPYDSRRFRVMVSIFNSTVQVQTSGFYSFENPAQTQYFEFLVPIKGWTSETQFLSLIPFTTEFKTTEQRTGKKWVDGKDIYEISVNGALANNDLIVGGVETMLEQGGSYLSAGTQYKAFPDEDGALSASFDFDTSTNEISAFMSASRDVKAWVRYTKV